MPLEKFRDHNQISPWAEKYLKQAVKWGLLIGDDEGKLRPQDSLTREELAAVLYRLLLSQPHTATLSDALSSLVFISASREEGTAIGSGFWLPNWHVITNAHVVFDGEAEADTIGVMGNPGDDFHPFRSQAASIVEVDYRNDLALLAVQPTHYDWNPSPVTFSERDIERGLEVWALGHPLAQSWDVCRGIIRHKQRGVNYWKRPQLVYALDVPINPGNSGGMLVNAKGKLVGVPCAGVLQANNLTYAVPLEHVKELAAHAN